MTDFSSGRALSAPRSLLLVATLLWPAIVCAQPAPIVASTLKTTNTGSTSVCVGCAAGSTTPATNSAITAHKVILKDATPAVTTNALYNIAGALFFNGLSLATGSSISGTTGTVPKFTAATVLGDSNATISGSNWTIAGGTLTATGFVGSGTSLTDVAVLSSATNTFTGGTAGARRVTLTNTTSGTTAFEELTMNAGTAAGALTLYSQGYTTSASAIASSLQLSNAGAGGVSISAINGSGVIRFYTGVTPTLYWGINAAGDFTQGTSSHIADSVGVPSISSGFGGAGSIGGNDYAFFVGSSGVNTTGTVNFGHTWSTTPICNVMGQTAASPGVITITPSTTQLAITWANNVQAVLNVLCRGY